MAKRKKKISPLQKAYAKQRKRILQFINRAEKRGYYFPENILPQKPKRITKASVERLRKITPETLYKKAEVVDIETGEVISAQQLRKAERQRSAQKAAQTRKQKKLKLSVPSTVRPSTPSAQSFTPPENIAEDTDFFDAVVITNYRAHVRQFNEYASNLLIAWLDRLLATNDAHDVAIMLEEGAENGEIVTYQIVYSQDKLMNYMSNMLDYLPEAGTLFKEEMMEAMELEEAYESPT